MSKSTVCRKIKDVYKRHTPLQARLRYITSNVDKDRTLKLKYMMEIERASYDADECQNLNIILKDRLTDKKEKWRHITKGLIVLEHLLIYGGARIKTFFLKNKSILANLLKLKHVDDANDVGKTIREHAKFISNLLQDDQLLKKLRNEAENNRDIYGCSKL